MAEFKETAFDYLDVSDHATFSSSERKWINKIYKLKEKYPNEVTIECAPDDNYGMLVAFIPKSWMKISPPKKVNLTDEQKAAMAERMRQSKKPSTQD